MVIDTLSVWHEFVRTREVRLLDDLLADDVVFHSPVVHTPQPGKAVTTQYLAAAARVLLDPSFRYTREVVGTHDAALEFLVELDGISVNGVDLIAWRADGRITDFKVMLRPLKAIMLVQERMAALLRAHP